MALGRYGYFGFSALLAFTHWTVTVSALYQGGGLTILTQNRLDSKSCPSYARLEMRTNERCRFIQRWFRSDPHHPSLQLRGRLPQLPTAERGRMGRSHAELPKDPQQLDELPGLFRNGQLRLALLDTKHQHHHQLQHVFRHRPARESTHRELQRTVAHAVHPVGPAVTSQLDVCR